ncbi:MAG: MoxR family ATPase [Firmicutes bacterium]|nr:MoxR family ATPase [Bacillota bacterium]
MRQEATFPEPLRPELEPLVNRLDAAVVGNRALMKFLVMALLAEGHVLLDDVPGVGKTTLAKTLAQSLALTYRRIQCTPDLLPSDITGVTIFHPGTRAFEFRPGPIFAQLVLADEINRASPRTQSALLEVMEEAQVTVDGTTHALEAPFLLVATQNPVEYEGTFPLPESQLDRFLVRLRVGYPTIDEETQLLGRAQGLGDAAPVLARSALVEMIAQTRTVHVAESLRRYMAELAYATRHSPHLSLGMSPRATLALYRASQAWAFLHDRAYVIPDDVIAVAPAVVEHRLRLARNAARNHPDLVHDVFRAILEEVRVPARERA